jgi:transcriptional regulator with XRE-family HTH domain
MGKLPARKYRPLYIGEWLAATGHGVAETAKSVGVDPSYISNMISNRRRNPAAHVLLAISEYLGVTVNDLYRRPPTREVLHSLGGLSPTALQSLFARLK